jgi:methylase of polypeptide subunit release factors
LSSRGPDLAVNLRRLARCEDERFDALVRLFVLGQPLTRREAGAALAPVDAPALEQAGLLAADGDGLRSTIKLVPHGDLLIASDLDRPEGHDDRNWVAGIHPPSGTLATLAVRRQVARTLDVGTGNGVQALLASKHSEHVVATDVNPRALAYAEFNARLNAVGNIEFREGSFFEPVAGETFDLIVSNPPYVISPESLYAYRDSGLPGDQVSREVVQAAAAHLTPGGFAHVLVSWMHAADARWDEPLQNWVEGLGCNAWLLLFDSDDPVSHAAGWLQPLAATAPDDYEQALDRWLAYLNEHGIETVSYGAVILQRRTDDGEPWTRAEEITLGRQSAGVHIERVFRAMRIFDADDWEHELLDRRLALVPQHRLRQEVEVVDGGLVVRDVELAFTQGLGFAVGLDEHTVHLLPLLDGSRTLREVLELRIEALGIDGDGAERYRGSALRAVGRLLELGFLEVA